jgi:hypothetical protein
MCTWYQESDRETSCALIPDATRTRWSCASNHRPWIDLKHGRVTGEDNIRTDAPYAVGSYDVVVKVNGETKTEATPFGSGADGDYVVDYEKGEILFHSAIYEGYSVTADFSHAGDDVANRSRWTLTPETNKATKICSVECQFSTNGIMNDTLTFQIMGKVEYFAPQYTPYPYPAGTLIPIQTRKYKRIQDYINLANAAYPIIPACGGPDRGIRTPMIVMVWNYRAQSTLLSSMGMEARVYFDNDIAPTTDECIITFYCTVEDES